MSKHGLCTFRVQEFRVLGFRVLGLSLGFGVQGLGFRVTEAFDAAFSGLVWLGVRAALLTCKHSTHPGSTTFDGARFCKENSKMLKKKGKNDKKREKNERRKQKNNRKIKYKTENKKQKGKG